MSNLILQTGKPHLSGSYVCQLDYAELPDHSYSISGPYLDRLETAADLKGGLHLVNVILCYDSVAKNWYVPGNPPLPVKAFVHYWLGPIPIAEYQVTAKAKPKKAKVKF